MSVTYDKILGELREKDSGGASYGPDVSHYSGHYIGEIVEWPAATPPAHCLVCDGSLVSRTTYAALFAVIGETYGAGDGETTFALPDRRGRFAEGVPAGGAVGTAIDAGLPGISGASPLKWTGQHAGIVANGGGQTGAFVSPDGIVGDYGGAGVAATSTVLVARGVKFSAAASNSIYGASDTVQPPALTMLFVIVAE